MGGHWLGRGLTLSREEGWAVKWGAGYTPQWFRGEICGVSKVSNQDIGWTEQIKHQNERQEVAKDAKMSLHGGGFRERCAFFWPVLSICDQPTARKSCSVHHFRAGAKWGEAEQDRPRADRRIMRRELGPAIERTQGCHSSQHQSQKRERSERTRMWLVVHFSSLFSSHFASYHPSSGAWRTMQATCTELRQNADSTSRNQEFR